ncbi:MAG TPA: 50S ribosomal protein L29 [Kofleriaceae bacterium]|jgi:large subunit ribosomal protein L29
MSKSAINLEQLRDQPDHELQQALVRTRDELFRLQLAQHTNQVTSTAALVAKRRDIARILTILRGRALGSETQGQKTEKTKRAQEAQDKATQKTTKTETAKP